LSSSPGILPFHLTESITRTTPLPHSPGSRGGNFKHPCEQVSHEKHHFLDSRNAVLCPHLSPMCPSIVTFVTVSPGARSTTCLFLQIPMFCCVHASYSKNISHSCWKKEEGKEAQPTSYLLPWQVHFSSQLSRSRVYISGHLSHLQFSLGPLFLPFTMVSLLTP
jgi:hypothetical protein